ncbi:probable serine/threonine-protein kinase clkA isoform X1 [Leptopilina heterotoma]|uniref:probable serine/threonine-protein kinase clkA isoform X1 n=1 Tax=Leptopilina heterotoma TaxID=63436 RepID=UPI001CA979E7|nr:probable serine/threonine-protein kinase clkA isoform X1 [Leptopilina heterotoma]
MPATMKNVIAVAIIFSISLVEAVPYSKYGRTCNDIGCPSNEVCVIKEDQCTYSNSQCGRYPTCEKRSHGEPTCSTMNCPTGQKCKIDNGRPVCVKSQENNWNNSEMTSWEVDNDLGVDILKDNTIGEYNDLRNGGFADFYGHFVKKNLPEEETNFLFSTRRRRDVDDSARRPSSGYPEEPKTGSSYPSEYGSASKGLDSGSSRASMGYPSGAGYSNPNAGQRTSSYPSYPSSGYLEETIKKTGASTLNAGNPDSGSSRASMGYPSGAGYSNPNAGQRTSSYPSYPSSGHLSEETIKKTGASTLNAGNPDSGSSRASMGYPSGAGYSNPNAGQRTSSYPGYPSSGYPSEETVRRTGASTVNAGYPDSGQRNPGYPSSGNTNPGYPNSGNPYSGYSNNPNQGRNQYQNPYYNQGQGQYNGQPYSNNYPNQYQNPNQYNNPNQYGNPNQGRYPQNYPSQSYPGNAPVTPKTSIGDRIQEYATNLLKKVVIQKVIDSVTKNNN